jgi:hypothetical protein
VLEAVQQRLDKNPLASTARCLRGLMPPFQAESMRI